MHTETIAYQHQGFQMQAYMAYDEKRAGKLPTVIVAHAWMGQDDFARKKAHQLAELGYVGFALDIYGGAKAVETKDEAVKLMMPLFTDRRLLQERMQAGFAAAKSCQKVDPEKIGGIGFCFGGLAIIELFRSGANLKGAVSFHAVLGNKMGDEEAQVVPIKKGIKGSLLMLHGYDDPLVSQEDIRAIQTEMTEAKVDWQMDIYGGTSHAFTVPGANDPSMGLKYNSKAESRSWKAMNNFFEEIFV